jgi:hypothetical protein
MGIGAIAGGVRRRIAGSLEVNLRVGDQAAPARVLRAHEGGKGNWRPAANFGTDRRKGFSQIRRGGGCCEVRIQLGHDGPRCTRRHDDAAMR